MARLFTIVQTGIQYGVARLRVLCSTRLWSVLTVSSIALVAVIGTSAAWRARTSAAESEPVAPEAFLSAAVALPARTPLSTERRAADTEAPAAPASVQSPTRVEPSMLPDDLRNPFTDTVIGDERAQRTEARRVRATQQQLEQVQTEVKIAEQRKELARITHETRAITHPSRAAKPTPPPPLPRLTVLSVSTTAALVQHGQWRQIVQRGTRLNGWTVVRLTPTGIRVQRGQRHALLPLSFAAPATAVR
jgi:hypothetical protein